MAFFFSSSTQCACARDLWRHRKEKSPNLAGTFHQWFSSMDHGLSAGNLLSSRLVHFSRCLCAVCVCARLTSSVACCSCVRVRLSSPMRHTSFLHYHYAFVHCVSSVLPSTKWRRFLDEKKTRSTWDMNEKRALRPRRTCLWMCEWVCVCVLQCEHWTGDNRLQALTTYIHVYIVQWHTVGCPNECARHAA